MLGVGLAAAVLIDATVVRGILLPACLALLGERTWYLPRWLGWLPGGAGGRAWPGPPLGPAQPGRPGLAPRPAGRGRAAGPGGTGPGGPASRPAPARPEQRRRAGPRSPGTPPALSALRFPERLLRGSHNLWTLTSVSQKSGMLVRIHDTRVS